MKFISINNLKQFCDIDLDSSSEVINLVYCKDCIYWGDFVSCPMCNMLPNGDISDATSPKFFCGEGVENG